MNIPLFLNLPLGLESALRSMAGFLLVLLGLMVIDVVLGVVIALVKHEFKWDKLTGYLESDFLPVIGWLVLRVILLIPAEYIPGSMPVTEGLQIFAYSTVFLKILGSIFANLQRIGVVGKSS
jgi:hypothetical protein